MPRPIRTKGERRIGRAIRKLESSVELSSEESFAKEDEKRYRQKALKAQQQSDDSPVQNLRNLAAQKKNKTNQ